MVTQRSNVISSKNVGLQKPKRKAQQVKGTETILQSTRNNRTFGFPFIILSVLSKTFKNITGCKEGKGNDAVHVLNTDRLCTCTFHGNPCIRCNVLMKVLSHHKANERIILHAITCVAWPCCCSCCSCCAVRKLTGLFPAISFVPAGIVVRMIFLPNPLMLRKENC